MPNPFIIVPWQNDFLCALKQHIFDATNNQPGNALIIFPHGRPRRYLTESLRPAKVAQSDGHCSATGIRYPFLMPPMFSVTEFFSRLRAQAEDIPPQPLETLDRVGILMQCLKELNLNPPYLPEPLGSIPVDDTARFFPWGMRLAALFEDFYNQYKEPEDYHYMEGQVADFAAALLSQLSRIHERYTAVLNAEHRSTPAYDAFRVLRLMEEEPDLLSSLPMLSGKQIFIAGFYGLTGVEEAMFRHLWEQHDATILLHSDHRLATHEREKAHWACKEHVRWLTEWNAKAEAYAAPIERTPQVTFHEGFDLHSQLDAFQQNITAEQAYNKPPEKPLEMASEKTQETIRTEEDTPYPEGGTAVVLPDTGLLMPVLHHLPEKGVNISMGYPLGRSTLFRLMETIMGMQERRRETASGCQYYWKDLIGLIRHPYLKMLSINGERPLSLLLHTLETAIRQGQAYSDPRLISLDSLLASLPETDEETNRSLSGREPLIEGTNIPVSQAAALLDAVFDITITRWETLQTPAELADLLADMCSLLTSYGGDLWDRFPIDAESMFRLMQRVIPSLREAMLAHDSFPLHVLFTILRQTTQNERVPFEATPLSGIQVLGMLESRLLHFSTVHLVDATEDKLPGTPTYDPLLPDALRGLLGLPDARHRERVSAYNFYRLFHGADTVRIYHQNGVDQSGLFDEKRVRSRFVEELLWIEERKRGKLIESGEPPLYTVNYPVAPMCKSERAIERTDAVDRLVTEFLRRPLSPSALDAYMTCPFRFFHERLCNLSEVDEVNEGDDHAGTGNLLHAVLEEYFAAHRGQTVNYGNAEPDQLLHLFEKHLQQSPLRDSLPFDSLVMLETAGRERLKRFLAKQPETTVLAVEQKLEAPVEVADLLTHDNGAGLQLLRLKGVIDRVDQRKDGIVILDYKTGTLKMPSKSLWTGETDLFDRMKEWDNNDPALLADMAENFRSVQLPAYLYLFMHSKQTLSLADSSPPYNAALVELRKNGEEKQLFDNKLDDEDRHHALTAYIPDTIEFLFRHLQKSAVFMPSPGNHCAWCSCLNCCSV